MRFKIGEIVRVSALRSSPWMNSCGVVVQILERTENQKEEYLIRFKEGQRRWFQADHLSKAVPESANRFFRFEVRERWDQLTPALVAGLTGDRDQLVTLLQDHFDFCARRATAEVDQFMEEFHSKLDRAGDPKPRHAASVLVA